MRTPVAKADPRRGMSLLELIVSTAIFFLSLVAIYGLLDISQRSGIRAKQRGQALRVCQARLAELVAGVLPLETADGSDELAQDYQWQISVENEAVGAGALVKATVVAFHTNEPRDSRVSLTQIMMDPAFVGSLMDAVPDPALASAAEDAAMTEDSSSGSSSTGGSSSGTSGQTSGGSSSKSSSGGSSSRTGSSSASKGSTGSGTSSGSKTSSGTGTSSGSKSSTGAGTSTGSTGGSSGSGGSRTGSPGGGR